MITETKKKVLELFGEGRKCYKLMKFADARDWTFKDILCTLQTLHFQPAPR